MQNLMKIRTWCKIYCRWILPPRSVIQLDLIKSTGVALSMCTCVSGGAFHRRHLEAKIWNPKKSIPQRPPTTNLCRIFVNPRTTTHDSNYISIHGESLSVWSTSSGWLNAMKLFGCRNFRPWPRSSVSISKLFLTTNMYVPTYLMYRDLE